MGVSSDCIGLGPLSLEQHLIVITWTCYWFDRSPGKAALWASDTASYETWVTENPSALPWLWSLQFHHVCLFVSM